MNVPHRAVRIGKRSLYDVDRIFLYLLLDHGLQLFRSGKHSLICIVGHRFHRAVKVDNCPLRIYVFICFCRFERCRRLFYRLVEKIHLTEHFRSRHIRIGKDNSVGYYIVVGKQAFVCKLIYRICRRGHHLSAERMSDKYDLFVLSFLHDRVERSYQFARKTSAVESNQSVVIIFIFCLIAFRQRLCIFYYPYLILKIRKQLRVSVPVPESDVVAESLEFYDIVYFTRSSARLAYCLCKRGHRFLFFI